MEARTVNTLPPAATHDDAVRCLLAIELSKKSWIVAVNTPLSDKVSRHTLTPCDGKELLDLCERIRTRVARETKQRVEIVSCYEAGYDGFWLHRPTINLQTCRVDHVVADAVCFEQAMEPEAVVAGFVARNDFHTLLRFSGNSRPDPFAQIQELFPVTSLKRVATDLV